MGGRILTVEDDDRIRTSLRLALEDEGYSLAEAESGEECLALLAHETFDLVLVDLMLPGIDGFDVVRAIRQQDDVPIVVVTARSDSHDVVAGLEAGADDFVGKPFVVKELTARIRAHLRRHHTARTSEPGAQDVIDLGSIQVRPAAGIVERDGGELGLTKTEFNLLCELAFNRGIVLSREQLLERVWGYDYFGDARLVDAHIRRLRTKIEDDPSQPEVIVTVRGLGYKVV